MYSYIVYAGYMSYCFFNLIIADRFFFPFSGNPSFDLGCLGTASISAYSISVKPTMNNKTRQTMCPYHSYTYDKNPHENLWY